MTAALAHVLGLELAEARVLARLARARLGRRGYALRALALLAAVSRPGRLVLGRDVRLRAVRPLVYELLPGPAENLVYVRRAPGA